jgi:cyanophycinase
MRRFIRQKSLLSAAFAAWWLATGVGGLAAVPSELTSEAELTLGPKRGTLMIVGGGGGAVDQESGQRVSEQLFRQFVKLAGGKNAKLVLVPTAMSSDPDFDYQKGSGLGLAKNKLKMPHVTVVHTHDPKVADTAEFCKPIEEADAVWFGGGRQWRFVDAYGGTRAEKAFRGVLDRGGAIGGSSAGATIQGSFLARGDTRGNLTMIGDHQRGFGYVTNCAIDQHVVARKRQNDLIELLSDPKKKMRKDFNRGAMLGIGIDEDSAIVVRGNQFEVIGKSDGAVLVYDPRSWKDDTAEAEKYVTLKKGARYDLKRRTAIGK